MKTDYAGHDRAYARLRAEGSIGWDRTEEAYRKHTQQLRKILNSPHVPRRGRLIELGCGAGNVTIWLARQGYEVFGVDIAPTAIEWARETAAHEDVQAAFVECNVLDLKPFADDSFDIAIDGHCFHCIIGDDRARFLSEAFRILKPGGYMVFDTMCGPVAADAMDAYDGDSRCTVFGDIATRYFGLPEAILHEVQSAGFIVLSAEVEAGDVHGDMIIQAAKPMNL